MTVRKRIRGVRKRTHPLNPDLVLEHRPDPGITDHVRLVTGLRRRDVLLDLRGQGAITARHYNAAASFLDLCSVADGMSSRTAGEPGGGRSMDGFPAVRLAAVTRLREAMSTAALYRGTAAWMVVFDNRTLGQVDRELRLRHGTAGDLLRKSLNALDEFFHTVSR